MSPATSNPPTIPGFAWNPETKRFYKLQQSGTAADTRSEYSRHVVEFKDAARQQEERKVKRRRVEGGAIKPSKLWSQLDGAILEQELGQTQSSLRNQMVPLLEIVRPPVRTAADSTVFDRSRLDFDGTLVDFAVDEIKDIIYTISASEWSGPEFGDIYVMDHAPRKSDEPVKPSEWRNFYRPTQILKSHRISSQDSQLQLVPGGYCTHINTRGDVNIIWGLDGEFNTNFSVVYVGLKGGAVNPFKPERFDFLAARHSMVDHCTLSQAVGGRSFTAVSKCRVPEENLHEALAWIKPDVFACRSQESSVQLVDNTCDTIELNTILTFKHPSAPAKIQRANLNGNTMIVQGKRRNMMLYDIRYLGGRNGDAVLEYDWINKSGTSLGLHVSYDFGIVAAAQDDHCIRVYDIKTGNLLHTLHAESADKLPTTYKQFTRVQILEKQSGGLRIVANYGGDFVEFGYDNQGL
jgi:hypothetical protein